MGAVIAAFVLAGIATGRRDGPLPAGLPRLGTPGAPTTSRAELARTVQTMEERLRGNPRDAAAAVSLADALLRQTRVTGNAGLARRAEAALRSVLEAGDYDVRRMLATVLLSQHRFREAIAAAAMAQAERPDDAWNDAVVGDAHLELGEYDEAFAAFDRMMARRPSAAAYARASYARELRGDLDGAMTLMQMAANATSPQDPESQAWHAAQLGHLAAQLGRLRDARRYFQQADFFFPGHPFAVEGLSRVAAAEGDHAGALAIARRQFDVAPSADLAAIIGDVFMALGKPGEAEKYYAVAESIWQYDTPDPAGLARFLADRNRRIPEALTLARQASAERHDIFTEDALAWASYKAGRIEEALASSQRALRTGTQDRHLVTHAAAIQEAAGDLSAARRLADLALAGNERFDLLGAAEAQAVLRKLGPPATARRQ